MNKKKIEKILEEYKYGRYNLLDDDFEIIETDTSFKLHNFFKAKEKTGDCIELTQHLFQREELYENIDIAYKVKGSRSPRSKIFTKPNSHMFLATPPQELIPELKKMNDYEKAKALSKTNFGVIDPSYGLVSDKKTTAYKINSIIEDNLEKETNISLAKPYSTAKIVVALEKDRVFKLVSDDSKLQIEIKDDNGNREYTSLDHFDFNKTPNINGSAEILTALQEKYESRKIKK